MKRWSRWWTIRIYICYLHENCLYLCYSLYDYFSKLKWMMIGQEELCSRRDLLHVVNVCYARNFSSSFSNVGTFLWDILDSFGLILRYQNYFSSERYIPWPSCASLRQNVNHPQLGTLGRILVTAPRSAFFSKINNKLMSCHWLTHEMKGSQRITGCWMPRAPMKAFSWHLHVVSPLLSLNTLSFSILSSSF